MAETLMDLIVDEGEEDAREIAVAILTDELGDPLVRVGFNCASLRPLIEAMPGAEEREALLLELSESALPEGNTAELVPLGARASAILLELHAMTDVVEILEGGVDEPGILPCGMVGDETHPPAWCVAYVASDRSAHLHLVFQEDRALELLIAISGIDEDTRRALSIAVQSYGLPESSSFEDAHLTGYPAKYFAACVDAIARVVEEALEEKDATGTDGPYLN